MMRQAESRRSDEVRGGCALHPWDEVIARELLASRVGSAVDPVRAPPGAPVAFAVARGTGQGLGSGDHLTLRPAPLERRLRVSRLRRGILHSSTLVASARAKPLDVLAEVTRLLPGDAYLSTGPSDSTVSGHTGADNSLYFGGFAVRVSGSAADEIVPYQP